MVENNGNGNGKDGQDSSNEGLLSALITRDEMVGAFKLAEELGVSERFGVSSPLGGVMILIKELMAIIINLEVRIRMLEAKNR